MIHFKINFPIGSGDKVTAYTKHDVEIGEIEIPIGESYKSFIKQIK